MDRGLAEEEWLVKHIKIMSLYTVETYALSGDNLIKVVKAETLKKDKNKLSERKDGFIKV